MSKNKRTGNHGESIAAAYLERKGYQILSQNWRNSYHEIDLIAIKDQILVFVEVKTRKSHQMGTPETAVGKKKQKHLFSAAEAFLQKTQLDYKEWRFDVIAITLGKSDNFLHIKDAFHPSW